MLLRGLQANSSESIGLTGCPKILDLSLITLVSFPLLNLLIDDSLMFCPVIGTFISQINLVIGLPMISLEMRIVWLLSLDLLGRDISTWGCSSGRRDSLRVITLIWVKIDLLRSWVYFVAWNELSYNLSDIWLICKSFKNVCNSIELSVVRVIIPWKYWHRILRL